MGRSVTLVVHICNPLDGKAIRHVKKGNSGRKRKATPFLKKSIGEHIKDIKMRDAHIDDRKVKPKGWEKVIRIDSQFVLVSDERFVNTIKAGAKFFMDVFTNFSRLVSKGDQRAKKHMRVLIEC